MAGKSAISRSVNLTLGAMCRHSPTEKKKKKRDNNERPAHERIPFRTGQCGIINVGRDGSQTQRTSVETRASVRVDAARNESIADKIFLERGRHRINVGTAVALR